MNDCPRCGAGRIMDAEWGGRPLTNWQCGRSVFTDDNGMHRVGTRCVERQLEKSQARVGELEAIVDKRPDLPFVFDFECFQQWVNKARGWFEQAGMDGHHVCVDDKDRICHIGRHFMLARDEDAFPIRVYSCRRIDQEGAEAAKGDTP